MIVAVIFWGCIATSVVLSACGVVKRSPRLLFLAAAFAVPLALYLNATPRFRPLGFLVPVPQLISGFVVRLLPWLAVVLAALFPLFVVWLEMTIHGSSQNAAV